MVLLTLFAPNFSALPKLCNTRTSCNPLIYNILSCSVLCVSPSVVWIFTFITGSYSTKRNMFRVVQLLVDRVIHSTSLYGVKTINNKKRS
jgi:hypothetical protein